MARSLWRVLSPILMAWVLATAVPAGLGAADTIDIDLGGGSVSVQLTPVKTVSVARPSVTQAPVVKTTVSKKAAITKISVLDEADETRVEVTGTGLTEPQLLRLKDPVRYALDFSGCVNRAAKAAVAGLVKQVRTGSPSTGMVRVVADAPAAVDGRVEAVEEGYALILTAKKGLRAAPPAKAEPGMKMEVSAGEPVQETAAKGSPDAPKAVSEKSVFNRLIGLSLKQTETGLKVVLTSDGPVKYTVRKLARPEKLVVRLHGTRLDVAERNIAPKRGTPAVDKGGLLMVQAREIGSRLAPISEIMLTLQPQTVHQVTQDVNQVVITLNAPEPEKTEESGGDLNKVVSVDLEEADLNTVLKTLGAEAGFDVDMMTGVSGTVQQRLHRVPLKQALAVLLAPGNYNYEIQGNMLRIGTAAQLKSTKNIMPQIMEILYPGNMTPGGLDGLVRAVLPDSNAVQTTIDTTRNALILKGTPADIAQYKRTMRDLKLDSNESDRITRIVKLNYADPAPIAGILGPYLTPQGRIQQDVRNSNLVIWEVASNMGVLLELIKELDVRLPQVLIESSIVEVSAEKALSLGLRWTANKTGTGDPTIDSNAILEPSDFAGTLTIGTVRGGFDISATLRALESSSDSKVISRPRVATASGVAASISTSETVVYTTTTQTVSEGVVTNTQVVNQLSLPINLNVTPRITDDGRITTQVQATIQSVSGPAVAGVPPTTTQTANTTITVKNGDTIVIGGLVRDVMQDRVRKIPLLGSLPILGTLFRSKETTHRKVELIIFITPTLLED